MFVCIGRVLPGRFLRYPDIPKEYKDIGQPVLVPEIWARSYLLVGTEKALRLRFHVTAQDGFVWTVAKKEVSEQQTVELRDRGSLLRLPAAEC